MAADTVTYVYCVVHREVPLAGRRFPPGIPEGTRPFLLRLSSRLWMVASEVPRSRYAPAEIERRMRDLDWVSGIAIAHEAVVEHVGSARGATVVPMKLFTMFSESERAVAEMRPRRREIEAVVKRIRECDEWGVRVTRGLPVRKPRARTDGVPSGAAFLAAKKMARDEAQLQSARLRAAADDVLRSLGRVARQARRRPPPESAAVPPLLEAAFLVPHDRKARFRTAAKQAAMRCRTAGAELTLTGPWPAYNFIDAEESRS